MAGRGLRCPLDRRAAGIGQAQEAADLVERLARRVVDRLAEEPVRQVVAHLDEKRVAAGHDQGDEGEDRRLAFRLAGIEQPGRVQVSLEVIDADERLVVDERERLGEIDPDEERAGETRSVRDRDRVHIRDGDAGTGEGLVEDRDDPAKMGACGDLGDDAAGRRVQRGLAGDDVGVDSPAALDDGDPRFVARRFDGQDQRPAHRGSASSGRVGAGAASSSARRRSSRSRKRGSESGSVVMIRASSPSSL